MKRSIILPFISVILAAGIFVLMLVANVYTFHRLTDESPIAELGFVAQGPREYLATIAYGDFCTPEHYTLYGDQWRLDAEFLKWRSWANLFGLDSMYRIERLGGRYRSIEDETSGPRIAHDLHSRGGVDLVSILAQYDGYLSPVDTLYGSSVYEEMREGYVYRVYRSQSGLLVRKEKQPGMTDSNNMLTIEINKACAE